MKLTDYLKINGLTYRAFSSKTGVSISTIHNYINMKRKIGLRIAKLIVDASDNQITYDDLLENEENKIKKNKKKGKKK